MGVGSHACELLGVASAGGVTATHRTPSTTNNNNNRNMILCTHREGWMTKVSGSATTSGCGASELALEQLPVDGTANVVLLIQRYTTGG